MEVFLAGASVELLDGIVCALLAAAASCRARDFGVQFAGACALGCICAILSPLARESFLHGSEGTRTVLVYLADDALLGSLGGIAAPWLSRSGGLFFWLDRLSFAMAATLAAVLAVAETGMAAALLLGLLSGFLPGMCRDVALGDTCLVVEKKWYAAACALGCICAICINILPYFMPSLDFMEGRIIEWSVLGGVLVIMAISVWQKKTSI